MLRKIVTVLRKNGNLACLQKAALLEENLKPTSSLHLRSLDLKTNEVVAITEILSQENEINNPEITSISLSYNPQLGDLGAMAIAKSLPTSIAEIGLVHCGIGDAGGTELLREIQQIPNLRMICMEQNNFSDALKMEFKVFQKKNPYILVVV